MTEEKLRLAERQVSSVRKTAKAIGASATKVQFWRLGVAHFSGKQREKLERYVVVRLAEHLAALGEI